MYPEVIKQLFLLFFGLCAGGVIAAGVFAFLAIIGVFPRVIGKSRTGSKILLYETMIILGGSLGNVVDLYEFPLFPGLLPGFSVPGQLLLGLWSVFAGIFVGCLVMSLAETLKAFPVISRRVHLSVGLPYIILAVALGKMCGSLFYFINGMGT